MFDDIPPWVLIGVPVGVVILALMSRGSSGGSPYGAVTAYQPTPADPGLVGLAESEVTAKSGAFSTLANIMGTEEVARIASTRDQALQTIQADVANQRTSAQLNAALAHETTSQLVGRYNADATTAAALAASNAAVTINKTNVAGATSQAHIAAKSKLGDTLINGAKTIAHFFGF